MGDRLRGLGEQQARQMSAPPTPKQDPVEKMWDDWYSLPQGARQRRAQKAGGEINAAIDYEEEQDQ